MSRSLCCFIVFHLLLRDSGCDQSISDSVLFFPIIASPVPWLRPASGEYCSQGRLTGRRCYDRLGRIFRLDSVDEREQAFHVLDKLRGKLAERNVREVVHDLPSDTEPRETDFSLLQLCLHVPPDLHILREGFVAQPVLA